MTEHVRAAIVGSTGYGGVELIRVLLGHPAVTITSVISSSSAGAPISEGFPHLNSIMHDSLDAVDVPLIASKADVVFLATPAGVAAKLAPQMLDAGLKVIDLSGDFRLKTPEIYTQWYKREGASQEDLDKAVFGLCEIYGEQVPGKEFISNPGCYPTATLLGLVPAVKAGWIDPSTIIVDAKSGISGGGRGLGLGFHYAEANENFSAYKLNRHQHIPEIEQVLSDAAGREVIITFSTHLVPMTRGIMATCYAQLNGKHDTREFIEMYRNFYEGRRFVRIREEGKWPATKEVWGSNYCDIGFAVDERTNRVTVVSVIDNVMKGAAGQAVQNLNLMLGWDETTGLQLTPVYP
ncbi:N-acetyl-gamma-glutamyl-phosphate reductase [Paenibacillus chitinolyticus]|uniref:N-acetyl-gamma-glutamyl-phosphate reductase n=1 Tax=Paenibacillus chitinolyticus TaxID=79263 RepID=A0A410WQP9_9BACL|nr:N-acetyl-gamma-glutamyl-phosphate reductase [Paenibacillus chitinolyticus]MCY9591676.1 N-acetyl-gamma-glutamyl-phosphate reductase [Paenibacillus chitinolyticus]MCY9596035.1 N-acetyl-gamma-glutamyl-phosphate reductase [Paenibacillus chitinolyticus]QAV16673.1 N-acetyl-gamma-glutamyl-phosphate reductase [Paenibacillus chitinolyticus]